MSDESAGKQTAFFWLAALVLGGLIFAAGVMVGRGLGQPPSSAQPDPLARLDQPPPPRALPDAGLDFPRTLEGPPLAPPRRPDPPAPARDAGPPGPADGGGDTDGQAGDPVLAAEPPARVYCLQVAAYREASQAEGLLRRLEAAGYPEVRLVAGEPGAQGTYHRVRVGRWPERAPAERAAERLAETERLKPMVMLCEQ